MAARRRQVVDGEDRARLHHATRTSELRETLRSDGHGLQVPTVCSPRSRVTARYHVAPPGKSGTHDGRSGNQFAGSTLAGFGYQREFLPFCSQPPEFESHSKLLFAR